MVDVSVDIAALLTPLAVVYCERGDTASARQLLDHSGFGDVEGDARLGLLLAEARVLRAEGALQRASAAADEVLEYRAVGVTSLFMKLAYVEVLEAAAANGDQARLLQLLGEIDALRPGERPPMLEAHAHRFHAKLTGDETRFRAAEALFRELSLVFWLGVTLLEHGEATGDEAALSEAREVFSDLKAAPWLERVDAATARRAKVPA